MNICVSKSTEERVKEHTPSQPNGFLCKRPRLGRRLGRHGKKREDIVPNFICIILNFLQQT